MLLLCTYFQCNCKVTVRDPLYVAIFAYLPRLCSNGDDSDSLAKRISHLFYPLSLICGGI